MEAANAVFSDDFATLYRGSLIPLHGVRKWSLLSDLLREIDICILLD